MFDTANNMRFKQRIYRLKTVRSAAQQKCNMGSEIGASLLGPLVLAEGPLRELLSLKQAEAAHARSDREILDGSNSVLWAVHLQGCKPPQCKSSI